MVNLSRHLNELYARRTVLWILVWQQLVLRYRRTVLGYLWSLINPLIMMSSMSLVFATLFKTDLKTFTIFLFTGMIPWNFFSAVVTQSSSTFLNNESLIKKIYLPKIIFPLSLCLSLLIDSLLSFVALFIIIVCIGGSLSWAVLFIPMAYFLLFIFAFGIGLIMSVATVYFRDLQHIILIAMQGLFFLTPIFYKSDALAGKVAFLVDINPISTFIDLFRFPLYLSTLPTLVVILKAMAFSMIAMILGLFFFLRQEKKIVFRL
jgi:ABC-type polysaccharide/polyol phosphate export permease